MNRKTASYWKSRREGDFKAALVWFRQLMQRNGLADWPKQEPDSATVLRDDIADFLAGLPVKMPNTDLHKPQLARKLNRSASGGHVEDYPKKENGRGN